MVVSRILNFAEKRKAATLFNTLFLSQKSVPPHSRHRKRTILVRHARATGSSDETL